MKGMTMPRLKAGLVLLVLAAWGGVWWLDAPEAQITSGTMSAKQQGAWTVTADQGAAGVGAWKVDGSAVTQPVSGTFWQATQPVSGTFWQATQPVSGTFWQATQPVSGTFFQATQPVSLATAPTTPVTGTFWQATQPVSGTFWQATQPVSIATMPTTPVTGTFWQATQPVSASSLPLPTSAATEATLAGLLTDTQLRATPVPISGTVTDGGAGKTIKRAVVALAATGDVIAAVGGKRLKVFHYAVQSRNDSMTVQFRDGVAGSSLGLRWALNTREGASGAAVNPPAFLGGTTAGNALQAVISGTGTVDIEVSYWDDDAA